MADGVFGGPTMPNHATASNPGSDSASVGVPGSEETRARLATASAFSLPERTCGSDTPRLSNIRSTCPPSRSASAGAVPLYGTCAIFSGPPAARHRLEELGGEVRGGAVSLRGVIQLSRIAFHQLDELLHRCRGDFRIHQQHVRDRGDHAHRHELRRVVPELRIEQPVDHQRRRRRGEQRVAVGLGLVRRGRADVAGGARPVVDDHRLAPLLRQLLADVARQQIGAAAGRERHDDAHRLLRPLLRDDCRCKQQSPRRATGRPHTLIIMSDARADLAFGRRDARPLLGLPGRGPVPRGAGEDLAGRHLELPLPRGRASRAQKLHHHLRRRHAGGRHARRPRRAARLGEPLRAPRRAGLHAAARHRRALQLHLPQLDLRPRRQPDQRRVPQGHRRQGRHAGGRQPGVAGTEAVAGRHRSDGLVFGTLSKNVPPTWRPTSAPRFCRA